MDNFTIPEYITLASLVAIAVFNYTQLKSGLTRVESNLKSDLSELKSELKSDLAHVESKIDKVESNLKSDLARVESKIDKVEESVRLLEKSDYFTKGYEQARRELSRNK